MIIDELKYEMEAGEELLGADSILKNVNLIKKNIYKLSDRCQEPGIK